MQVAQTETLRPVHDHRVGIRNVDAVFDDGRGKQDVIVPVDELQDLGFQFLGFHLAVRHTDFRLRADAVQGIAHGKDVIDPVVHEIHLSAALDFPGDDIGQVLFVETDDFRGDGDTVGRRGIDDREIARTQQGELQRARNRRSGEGQRIDRGLHLADLFLGRDAELLLLVDDEQTQILEFQAAVQNPMRSDQNIGPSAGDILADLLDFLGSAQTADVIDPYREILETGLESLVVLQRENRGRHQHSHLFAVAHGFESGTDGYFGLAEAHVAADQAVHGVQTLHIGLHGLGCGGLVGRILEHERGFEFLLHERII